jgi:RHS repeat-associated protein
LNGALSSLTYPSGRTVSYGLDSAGRVNSISGLMTGQNTSYASNVLYMPWDAIQQASFGSLGLGEAWMYNKRMQPLEVNRTFNSTPLLTVNNYYCPGTTTDCSTNNGNVQSQWIARNGSATPWVQSFGYDGVNRLSQAAETLGQGGTQSWQEAYGYDAYGNRSIASSTFTWSAMTPPGFDPATNRNSGGGWSPATSYDSVGNVTADPMGGAYQYDAENRMVSANGTTYQYDGEGRRVSKSGGGATTTYLYDASGQLLTEYGAVAAASGTQYVGVDGLGSTRLLTDASGNLPPAGGCHDYLPFGTELTQGMAGNRGSCFGGTDGVEEKFTGKERDAETGLDYFGARYFSSAQGRFTSADWSGTPEPVPYANLLDPQTLNLYAYVRDNPLSRPDLDGHSDYIWQKLKNEVSGKGWKTDAQVKGLSVAQTAESHVGSMDWAINTSNSSGKDIGHPHFKNPSNKCNEFVGDTLAEAGKTRPEVPDGKGGTRMPNAHELADPKVHIPGLSDPKPLSEAQPGDVIAQAHGDFGHSGIVVAPGQTASVNTAGTYGGQITQNDWGFRPAGQNGESKTDPAPVVRTAQ